MNNDKILYDHLWNKLIKDIGCNPRDFHTVPKNSRAPKWYHASMLDNHSILVSNARDKSHVPACKISGARPLSRKEFEVIYPIYLRRERGEAVSQEAQQATRSQVYWYGIFSECLYNQQ